MEYKQLKRLFKKATRIKPKAVAVSGGFDPLHVGHIRHFEGDNSEAIEHCSRDELKAEFVKIYESPMDIINLGWRRTQVYWRR